MYLKASLNTPVSFISGGQFISDEPWRHKRRCIDSFELIIGVRGRLPIRQDDQNYRVQHAETLLVLPGHVHEGFEYAKENLSFYWVHFQCMSSFQLISYPEAMPEISLIKNGMNHEDLRQYVYIPIHTKLTGMDKINILFHQLMHLSNSGYYTRHGVDYLTSLLLIEISQQTISNFEIKSNRSDRESLSLIMEWVRAHYMKNISVAQIAEEFNYNRDYLSRFFKKKTGINLQEFIHRQKLAKAKELLLTDNRDNVVEIANSLGFRDEKYFMRLFKKYEHVTPTEFRKAYHRTHLNNH